MRVQPQRKHASGGEGGSLRWVLTYSDTLTLLFTLFVVLWVLNVSTTTNYHSQNVLDQSLNGMTVIGKAPGPSVIVGQSGGMAQVNQFTNTAKLKNPTLNHLYQELRRAVAQAHLTNQVHIAENPLGVRVSLAADLLFPPGSATLTPQATSLLVQVAEILNTVPNNPVEVVGYTDDTPINTRQFPSNWQLGAARSANVTEELASAPRFNPDRLMQSSFSQYRPSASNSTVSGRADNRHVDILVMTQSLGNVIESTSSGSIPVNAKP